MSTVTLSNLTKRYGKTTAVESVSVEIAEGEFFSLLGPSGCGKSTTLRLIAGFEEITSGAIELDGRDVSNLPPEDRQIGFVFQNYAIFPHMNVFDNIAFGLRLRKLPSDEINTRVMAVLDQVGMKGFGDRFQREMSGGQQQRVALARVLVTEPRILLLDEPLSALDKNLREEMKFWIKDLQHSLGITTIYVTHDQGEALTMSDRIAVMKDGHIMQIGSPQDIYEHPESRFVTEFIGESNTLDATVVAVNGALATLDIHGQRIEAPADGDMKAGESLVFVIRPERLIPGPPPEPEGWSALDAVLTSMTYQGAQIRYAFDLSGQGIIVDAINRHDRPTIREGETVTLAWKTQSGWHVRR